MEQLTVWGFGDELVAAVRQLAAREKISLNRAALKLLRRGAGLSDDVEQSWTVGTSLDDLIGSWTVQEANEFESAIAALETIDEDAWA
ncbi:MAG: hypothetical protein KTU85_02930 [Acidimicrobiia bacterium]|nr:hypothetical protein [Acidimicrobiia bacterium]MCY4458690.1 hypothetical protein [Acidimicrobiaceae bacterium]